MGEELSKADDGVTEVELEVTRRGVIVVKRSEQAAVVVALPADPDAFTEDEMATICARHAQLRGTPRLKYYPPDSACTTLCNYRDSFVSHTRTSTGGIWNDHQCFLVPNHDGLCQFSSECIKQHLQGVSSGIIEQAAVTAVN